MASAKIIPAVSRDAVRSPSLWIGVLLLMTIFSWVAGVVWQQQAKEQEKKVRVYRESLEKANSYIRDANDVLSGAREKAWTASKGEMSDMLESLPDIPTVKDPYQ